MITKEQSDFLAKEGYLVINTLELLPNEFYEAESVLQNYIENQNFTTLVCNPHLWEDRLDDVLKMFPGVTRCKLDEWCGPQESLVNYHNWIIDNFENNSDFDSQIWLYTQHRNLFVELKKNISYDVYGIEPELAHGLSLAEFTLYIPGSRTPLHQDGCESGRHCVILTYFSKDWKGNGGLFKFTDVHGNLIEIHPKYGTSLILDFTDKNDEARNNLVHEVTKVENNFWRYTHLDSINSLTWHLKK